MTNVNCHTDMPPNTQNHISEYLTAQKINGIGDNKFHLWYNLNFIPNVNDIDILLWHEDVGVFIIEVKGIYLNAILSYGFERCHIEGREPDKTPPMQALIAQYALINYIKAQHSTCGCPFIIPTACFPKIKRSDWRKRWDDERIQDLSASMIFKEDLESGLEFFINRLKKIYLNPPIGKGSNRPYVFNQDQLDFYINNIAVNSKPVPSKSELDKLQQLESNYTKKIIKEFPTNQQHKIVLKGKAGTGKTFFLLALAMNALFENKKCIYICFNKVLATDIRRLFNFSKVFTFFPDRKERFEIKDIYELLAPYASALKIGTDSGDYDQWAQLIIDELGENNPTGIPMYDMILIDEAQDLPEWSLSFLNIFSKPNASIFIANGQGQGLYNEPPNWLIEKAKLFRNRGLNRNFRNSKPNYVAAQVFNETYPDIKKIDRTIEQFSIVKSGGIDELQFDRSTGIGPRISVIDDTKVWSSPKGPDYDLQTEIMVNSIRSLIKEEIEQMHEDCCPIDILILVPDTTGQWKDWVRAALREEKIDYIDYVEEANRRTSPNLGQVRLCTFHSSRGIEGLRVIIFGIEALCQLRNDIEVVHNNIGYIILSRALLETNIIRVQGINSTSSAFIETLVSKVALKFNE